MKDAPKMLLHIIPILLVHQACGYANNVSVEIPEIKLKLNGETDLTVGTPYPNKLYNVAYRKGARKFMNGLLIESPVFLSEFTVIITWKIGSFKDITHTIKYTVSDSEMAAVTDSHMLLGPIHESFGEWTPRPLIGLESEPPVNSSPRMDFLTNEKKHSRGDVVNLIDSYSPDGVISNRDEFITVPTVEIERLTECSLDDRIPKFKDRFVVK